ncbi:MAG: hypothetical protein NC899_08910, partial [Candidatus Omnitrophica bacterium]|nr:hypothetical protein [Candidatus Omnitrophota bacterium]
MKQFTLNIIFSGFLLFSICVFGLEFEQREIYRIEKEGINVLNKGILWEDLITKEGYLNGCFKGKFIIKESFVSISPYYPGSNWSGIGAGEDEFLPGYEAGIILRKKDKFYYRVCFSTTYKEIGIWKKNGGWIAIKDYPFEIGKEYEFNIEFSENRIKININGEDIIDFYDVRPVIQKGKLGLSCKESSVIFKNLNFISTNLDSKSKKEEISHSFYYKNWHNQDWVFDNLEPICRFNKNDMTLYQIKLAPSFRAIGYFPLCWLQYLGPDWYANKIKKFEVIENGEKIKFLSQGTTQKEEIISNYIVTISYDKENKSYIYDIEAEFEVCQGKIWPNAYSIEFFNFLPYNVVKPSIELPENQKWENYYGWIVWKSKDGNIYKHPINHNGFYPGYGEKREFLSLSKEDGFLGFFNEEINPLFRVIKSQEEIIQSLCAWSHDIHIAYNRPKNPLLSGTKYFIHYQLTGLPKEKGEEILSNSKWPPDAKNLDLEYPYYKKGVNDFKDGIKIASPHQVLLWRKGKNQYVWYESPDFWDKKNGYDDNFSIKIDGPYEIRVPIGPSWFGENYTEKKYLITAYLKTQDVKGNGPYLGFECLHKKDRKDFLFTYINGTKNWTKIGFITEKLTGFIQGDLILGLDGTGICWFDNVEIKEIKEGEKINIPEWKKTKSPSPLKNLIVWLKFNEGEGNGVFDYSYNGNSAEIRNLKWTKDENKGSCIEFDGKGILIIKDKEELNFTNGFTFYFDIKPNEEFKLFDGATLLRKYNHLVVSLIGKKSPYKIGIDINGKWGKNITEPIIYGDKWSKI